jgi:hypothetical protein
MSRRRVRLLDASRATLELTDPANAAFVDEVEVGRRVAGHIRVAFGVADSAALTGDPARPGRSGPRSVDSCRLRPIARHAVLVAHVRRFQYGAHISALAFEAWLAYRQRHCQKR